MPYNEPGMTLIETPLFSRLWPDYWDEDERGAFCAWLASYPDAGDVIPGSGGCRKVRWSRRGMGKRAGVRVIYYLPTTSGPLWLLLIYAKNAQDNIPAHILRDIRKEIDHG